MNAVGGASRGCPSHGTHSTASVDDMSLRAARMARKRRDALYARGLLARVDAGAAVDHLNQLLAQGATREAIARASGCSLTLLRYVLNGHQTRIHRDTEARILRVRWGVEIADTHGVPAVGTRRRLQGLVAMGYETTRLAAEVGISRDTVTRVLHGKAPTVLPGTAQRVEAAARRLVLTSGGSAIAARRARRYGWVPLAAWDDIDNPAASPDLGDRSRRDAAVVEDTAELIALGVPREEIARRIGLGWNSILKTHARCGVSLMGAVQ